MGTRLGCRHVRRHRARAPIRDLRQRRAWQLPDRSRLGRSARARRTQSHVPRGLRLRRGRRRHRGDDARESGGVRALADRSADAPRRLDPEERHRGPGNAAVEPVRSLPDRRARDGTPRCRRRRRPSGCGRGRSLHLLEPGLATHGGDRAGDGRLPALVPALLEHVERAGREPRLARGALRVLGNRAHAGHDDARLADPRSRPRLSAVSPRQGDRAVHERSGLRRGAAGDAATGVAAKRPHHAFRDRNAPCSGRLVSRVAPRERSVRARSRGRPSLRRDVLAAVALVGRPRLSPRANTAADPAEGGSPSRRRARCDRARNGRARRVQSRRTPGGRRDRDHGRAARDRRRRWPDAFRSCSTAASARAPTCSARSHWARQRSGSVDLTSGGSLRAARTGFERSIRNLRADFDLTMGLAGVTSAHEIGRDNVTRV